MAEQFSNNGITTLASTITSGATTLTVGSAANFPGAGSFTGNFRIIIDSEIMLVTGVSSTTFTVTRGIEGTTAVAHSAGTQITHIITAQGLFQGISDNCALGYQLFAAPFGVDVNVGQFGSSSSQSSSNNTAYAAPLFISSPMYVAKAGFPVVIGTSGSVQWGLFAYTPTTVSAVQANGVYISLVNASATAPVQVVGGTGTLNGSNNTYQSIAALSVTLVPPGNYMMIFNTFATAPTTARTPASVYNGGAQTISAPWAKYQTAASWVTSPNLTTGWTTDSYVQNVYLQGQLISGTNW